MLCVCVCVHLCHLKGQWNAKAIPASHPCPTSDLHSHLRCDPSPYPRPSLIACPFWSREPFKSIPVFSIFLLFLFCVGVRTQFCSYLLWHSLSSLCSYIGFYLVAKIYLLFGQSTVSTVFIDQLSCGNDSLILHVHICVSKVDNWGHFIRILLLLDMVEDRWMISI